MFAISGLRSKSFTFWVMPVGIPPHLRKRFKILTENDEEIELPELSQDEQDKVGLDADVEKDLKNVTIDIDDMISDTDEKTEVQKEIEEETAMPSSLEDIDLFDDFGDFDE